MELKVGREYIGFLDPWTDEERLTDEEITRCKDCKHYRKTDTDSADACLFFDYGVDPDGFCSWGERAGESS